MSLTVREPQNYFAKGFLANVETAKHSTRGTGANVHDALRSLLFHLKVEHGFTLEDFARLHDCPDSPTRRNDLTPGEAKRLIEGMFADGFDQKVQLREEAKQRGEVMPQPKAAVSTEEQKAEWLRNVHDTIADAGVEDAAPEDWLQAKLVPIPENPRHQFLTALETLYKPNETVSLVTACNEQGSPIANDTSMYPEGWRKKLSTPNNFGGRGGVWWRHNPVSIKGGSGKNGAVRDEDIPAPRYLLLENDFLPIELQHRLLMALWLSRFPIRCVVDSGGKSIHALLETQEYLTDSHRELLYFHDLYGFDRGNGNPSRMSRAPGFVRGIKVRPGSDGLQRLWYLHPPTFHAEISWRGRGRVGS